MHKFRIRIYSKINLYYRVSFVCFKYFNIKMFIFLNNETKQGHKIYNTNKVKSYNNIFYSTVHHHTLTLGCDHTHN